MTHKISSFVESTGESREHGVCSKRYVFIGRCSPKHTFKTRFLSRCCRVKRQWKIESTRCGRDNAQGMTDVARRDYVLALKGRRTPSGVLVLTYRLRDTVTLVNVEFEYKRDASMDSLPRYLNYLRLPSIPLLSSRLYQPYEIPACLNVSSGTG